MALPVRDTLWARHGWAVLAVVFFIVFAFPFFRPGLESDFYRCFLRAANRMQAGEAVHVVEPSAYAYPPVFAMLCVPLAWLPTTWSLVAWYAVNMVLTVAAFAGAWRLAGLSPDRRMTLPALAIVGLTLLLAVRFFGAPLENQQFDMLVAALLFAGCLQLARGRGWLGGIALGVATGLKCTPLLFAPYLLWRRQWTAAGCLLAVAAAINLAPDVVYPKADGGSYLADWHQTFFQHSQQVTPGQWHSDIVLNQSLSGLLNRWQAVGLPTSLEGLPDLNAGLPPEGAQRLRRMFYAASLALLMATVLFAGRPWAKPCRTPAGPHGAALVDLQVGIESAAVVCLMLLLSPMSSKAHYVVLVLPVLLLSRWFVETRDRVVAILLAMLLVTGPLTAQDIAGDELGDLLLIWGVPTWNVMISLAGMWWLMRRRARIARQVEAEVATNVEPLAAPHFSRAASTTRRP